jgi:ATP-dependent protease ClpP protease subunit
MHVNSPGGDYFDGIAILNSLRDHPARVVATVDGLAASAASFIVMAADELVMARNSETDDPRGARLRDG